MPRVVVVGGGFSGTLVALRILDLSDAGAEIVVIEREPANLNGGLAFGQAGAGWEHLLNIQAGRVSLFREEPDDFLRWARDPGTDRSGWPATWRGYQFTPSSPVPRRVFARYLASRLAAVAAARPQSAVRQVTGTVTDAGPAAGGVVIDVADGDARWSIRADAAVLATGHWHPRIPPAFRRLAVPAGLIITDPYSAAGRQQLTSIPPAARVLIVGTGLTANDVITTLLRGGHRGPVWMVSRHGFEHRPYPPGHLHDIPALTGPVSFPDARPGSAEEFTRLFLRDFARVRHQFAGLPAMVRDERTWKALEPAIARFCQAADPALVKELIGQFRSAMVTSRIGTVTEILDPITQWRQRGGLVTLAGEITAVGAAGQAVSVTITAPDGSTRDCQADRVVLAAGRVTELSAVTDQLWSSLRRRGQARAEPVTGLGVAADDAGRLAGPAGTAALFTVGPMRQGSELVRRGRTGAFVFSIGTLRNQAHQTALAVTQRLRRRRLAALEGPGTGLEAAAAERSAEPGAAAVPGAALIAADPAALRSVELGVGYPLSRPPGHQRWDTARTARELAARGAPAGQAAALAVLEELEARAVGSLTDISRLAPELAERIARQRDSTSMPGPPGRKGKAPMTAITVELARTGATATQTRIREHQVVIDRPEASGGGDAGPMGGELLLASIGGCYMSTFIAAANARKISVDGASCAVTGTFAEQPPRRFASIELAVSCPDCLPDDLEHLVRVAEQGCVVVNTLRGSLDLSVTAK